MSDIAARTVRPKLMALVAALDAASESERERNVHRSAIDEFNSIRESVATIYPAYRKSLPNHMSVPRTRGSDLPTFLDLKLKYAQLLAVLDVIEAEL